MEPEMMVFLEHPSQLALYHTDPEVGDGHFIPRVSVRELRKPFKQLTNPASALNVTRTMGWGFS